MNGNNLRLFHLREHYPVNGSSGAEIRVGWLGFGKFGLVVKGRKELGP
jgi:hypothetical protein